MNKRQAELFPGLQSSKKYASDYPLLVLEWHPTKNGNLTPDDYLHKSGKKVWWKCEYGHEWDARIITRVNGSGCPYCGHKLTSPDNNCIVLSAAMTLRVKISVPGVYLDEHMPNA